MRTNELETIAGRLEESFLAVSRFIRNYVNEHGSFGTRSFYGESFALCLLSRAGDLDRTTKDLLLSGYDELDKDNPEFHWEFNNYAFLEYRSATNDDTVSRYLTPLRFKGTTATNWTLLRSVARMNAGQDEHRAINEARSKLRDCQLDSGLIVDNPGVRSFQYHSFSLAMVAELYNKSKDDFFLQSYQRGLGFIRHFVLSNGDTNYVGRGQEQSFGYGALIYVLALGVKATNDPTMVYALESVCSFLLSYQRKDGSIPLVLGDSAPRFVAEEIPQDRRLPGWYAYNNYFDYLAFCGCFLAKSLDVVRSITGSIAATRTNKSYADAHFVKIVSERYEAVIARPGGYWTNDLPMPYIVHDGRSLMPCYGGEQFAKSVYGVEGLPLPFSFRFNVSLRTKRLFAARLRGNTMIAVSWLGFMIRHFDFDEDGITITTTTWSYANMEHTYLFKDSMTQTGDNVLEDRHLVVSSDRKFGYDSVQYSASGRLKRFRVSGRSNRIRIQMKRSSDQATQ